MATQKETGNQGEEDAIRYLKQNGYKILETKWQFKKEEIDIIAENEDWLIFVEVKTRENDSYGEPQEFVTKRKQKNLIQAANDYIESNDLYKESRFDIIAITLNPEYKLIHITEAFYP